MIEQIHMASYVQSRRCAEIKNAQMVQDAEMLVRNQNCNKLKNTTPDNSSHPLCLGACRGVGASGYHGLGLSCAPYSDGLPALDLQAYRITFHDGLLRSGRVAHSYRELAGRRHASFV